MARGLMVVLAVAATAAHAQEAKGGGSTDPATSDGEEGAIMLAARTTPEPRSVPLARNAGAPDAGTDAGTMIRESTSTTDYVISTYLSGGLPAVRTYQEPAQGAQEAQGNAWEQAPYVKSITRCGQLYIFQVLSESTNAWAIDRVRLEGPKGEALRVIALHSSTVGDRRSVNVIVAEAPPGTKLSKLKLHLTGQDGRVAQPEARDLP